MTRGNTPGEQSDRRMTKCAVRDALLLRDNERAAKLHRGKGWLYTIASEICQVPLLTWEALPPLQPRRNSTRKKERLAKLRSPRTRLPLLGSSKRHGIACSRCCRLVLVEAPSQEEVVKP